MMPLWHLKGGQNPSGIRSRVVPADYVKRVDQFVKDYKVGDVSGIPLVAPPAEAADRGWRSGIITPSPFSIRSRSPWTMSRAWQ